MGTFYTKCKISNNINRRKSIKIAKLLVDTGSELSWIDGKTLEKNSIDREKKDVVFIMVNGQTVTRSIGFAIFGIDGNFTIDEVVFAEKGDLTILGARTLEGLNLVVDPQRKKLVASGPVPAA